MSEFDDSEDRLSRLEKIVAGVIGQLEKFRKDGDETTKILIRLHDYHISLTKFVINHTTNLTPSDREQKLAALAQHEKNWDEVVLPFLRQSLLPPLRRTRRA